MKKNISITKALQYRKRKDVLFEERIGTVKRVVLVIAIIGVLFSYVFGVKTIAGSDMYPAVNNGDLVVYFRLSTEYSNGDVVLYEKDGKSLTGRIRATEKAVVNRTNTGELTIDGRIYPIDKDRGTFWKTVERDNIYPVTISKNCYWIMGDKRNTATDSRVYGEISKNDIKGKVFAVIRTKEL